MSASAVRMVNCPTELWEPARRALLDAGLLPEGQLAVAPEVIVLWLDEEPGRAEEQVAAQRQGLRPAQPAILGVGPASVLCVARSLDLDAYVAADDPSAIATHAALLARCRRRFAQTSPLTGLPGGPALAEEIERRLPRRGELAVLAFDLDSFKGYNDFYGYQRGDALLRWLAALLIKTVSEVAAPGWLLGHLGGDDFLGLVRPDEAARVAEHAIARFTAGVAEHYDPEDRQRGGIATRDRRGEDDWQPLVGLTIAQATNEADDIIHGGQIAAILAELKRHGKTLSGSRYVPDRRRSHTPSGRGASPTPQAPDNTP